MKLFLRLALCSFAVTLACAATAQYKATFRNDIAPKAVLEFSVGTPISGLRAVPVKLDATSTGILIVYHEKKGGGGPNPEYFEMPEGTLSFVMFDLEGKQLWRKDLGKNVMPNTDYCPVMPFDLDGDGSEEVWFVNNSDTELPLATTKYMAEALNAKTGETLRSMKWPAAPRNQPSGNIYRLYFLGCYVKGKPVLITGQGIYQYGPMHLNGYDQNLKRIWHTEYEVGAPGPRGSHTSMIVDIDQDGEDEFLWGERCIQARDGKMKFNSCDNKFTGHTDVAQPVYNYKDKRWYVFCCRENGETPRVVLWDDKGKMVWSDREGHVDKGWVAHYSTDGSWVGTVLEIGHKYKSGTEVIRENQMEYHYNILTGETLPLLFKGASSAHPVDFNGDGIHELIDKSKLVDVNGARYSLKGRISHISKFMAAYPGEQIITWEDGGVIRVWANAKGEDSPEAKARYANPFYRSNQRMSAVGSNTDNLGGI